MTSNAILIERGSQNTVPAGYVYVGWREESPNGHTYDNSKFTDTEYLRLRVENYRDFFTVGSWYAPADEAAALDAQHERERTRANWSVCLRRFGREPNLRVTHGDAERYPATWAAYVATFAEGESVPPEDLAKFHADSELLARATRIN